MGVCEGMGEGLWAGVMRTGFGKCTHFFIAAGEAVTSRPRAS